MLKNVQHPAICYDGSWLLLKLFDAAATNDSNHSASLTLTSAFSSHSLEANFKVKSQSLGD